MSWLSRRLWPIALVLACSPACAQALLGFNLEQGPFELVAGSPPSPTAPNALRVLLDGPAMADTFISLSSSAPSVAAPPRGVEIFLGQSSAFVPLDALSVGQAQIWATLGTQSASVLVDVLSPVPEVPSAWTLAFGLLALCVRVSGRSSKGPLEGCPRRCRRPGN